MNKAISKSGKMLLSPTDHTLIMINFQRQMAFATKSIDAVTLRNNAALAANAALVGLFGILLGEQVVPMAITQPCEPRQHFEKRISKWHTFFPAAVARP